MSSIYESERWFACLLWKYFFMLQDISKLAANVTFAKWLTSAKYLQAYGIFIRHHVY